MASSAGECSLRSCFKYIYLFLVVNYVRQTPNSTVPPLFDMLLVLNIYYSVSSHIKYSNN